jgi:hypothetical protein
MTKPKQMCREKWLAKEEGDSYGEEVSKVTPARGEDNPGSRDGNLESGNGNPESETATRNGVTASRTRVTVTQVRRMTGKERSQS